MIHPLGERGPGVDMHLRGSVVLLLLAGMQISSMIHPLGERGPGVDMHLRGSVVLLLLAGMQICLKCVAGSTSLTPRPTNLALAVSSFQGMTPTPTTTARTTAVPANTTSYRLPTSVYPLHYNLELQPYINYTDPSNFTFRGSVQILVRCVNATDTIILHVNGLTVDNASITLAPETPSVSGDPNCSTWEEDKERHFFIVRLDSEMEAGKKYWIQLTFTAPLTNALDGVYYSISHRGDDKVYTVATQFETIYARKAFPCFDEPAMRATFNVTIVRPADRISLSNMPIDHSGAPFEEGGTKYVKDVFQQTPKMPTYLLAFVVCDFMNLTSITKNNVIYRTWAKPEYLNATQFALDTAVQVNDFFENYFDIDYPLPKQDIVGVQDFASWGMENWGLIIVRDNMMIYTKGITTELYLNYVVRLVTHELAHMWSGNIVSPLWWDDSWLNEAFSSFFEHVPMKTVLPEWIASEYVTVFHTLPAFTIDDKVDSIPMSYYVEQPKELDHVLTDIIYSKGAAVVRMLHFVLGDSTFRSGYSNFLKNHLYGSASREDLYRAMTEQATSDCVNMDVKDFLDTWVIQRNFPLVMVTRNCINITSLQVTQERFLQDPSTAGNDTQTSPFGYRWNIPLTFASSSSPAYNPGEHDVYWLHKEEQTKLISVNIALPNCTDPDGWILANVQQYGYYRVNYHIDNWLALVRQLKRNHIVFSANNRVQIISDAWSLARANYIPLNIALETLEYLQKELYYSPWSAAQDTIHALFAYLELTPLGPPFKEFLRSKLSIPFSRLGLVNISEDHRTAFLQERITSMACWLGVSACLDQAKTLYRSLMESRDQLQIAPDFKTAVYCTGVAEGSTAEWEFALEMFKCLGKNDDPDPLLIALACSRNTDLLNRYLNSTITDNATFSAETANIALHKVMATDTGRAVAWDFFKTHVQTLQDMDNKTFACATILPTLTEHFNSEAEKAEVYDFHARHCPTFNMTDFQKAVITPIEERVNWFINNSPVVRAWLFRNGTVQN